MRIVRRLGLAAALFYLPINAALAQGATGGSIGKQDKSVSGGGDGGGSSRSTSRERSHAKRSNSGAVGGGGNFDGKWNAASVGNTCPGAMGVIIIAGGQLTGNNTTGRVSGNGSLSGTASGGGYSSTFSGRLSGNNGRGTFQRSDGCKGTWTMTKQ